MKAKILFIAPLPPPLTGQSVISKCFLDCLLENYDVEILDFNKDTLVQGISSLRRILDIIKMLLEIKTKARKADIIYLTISQSWAGNIKDLFTYLLCFSKLHKMIIHLHGGGIRKKIFIKYSFFCRLNRFFLNRIGAVVVLGNSLRDIFKGVAPYNKIYVVHNFAEDYLFLNQETIKKKFRENDKLRLLYLSNFMPGKGYNELLNAYQVLADGYKKGVEIDFAGAFVYKEERNRFLGEIGRVENLHYHGVAADHQKKELFARANIFCLPTSYEYEGQPVSILEAYAAGCVVLTTNHAGIRDIFENLKNGFEVEKNSFLSIKKAIEYLFENRQKLLALALYNRDLAEKSFTRQRFISSMQRIIQKVSHD